MQQLQLSFFFW